MAVADANLPPPFQLERYYNKSKKYVLEKIRIWEASDEQKFCDAALLWKDDYERDVTFYQRLEIEDPARARSFRANAKTVSKLIMVDDVEFFADALKAKGLNPKEYLTPPQLRALAMARRKVSQTSTTSTPPLFLKLPPNKQRQQKRQRGPL